jgi:peptidoglycan-associated lipoprotein
MKMKSFGLVLLVVALGLSLSACGCFQQAMRGETAPAPAAESTKIAPPESKEEIAVQQPPSAPAPVAAVEPAVAAVELNDAYFDFDKYDIRPGDAEILNKDYGWFTANTGRGKIEGYCDERGTVEYNLVLGQKRADSTKSYMTKLGVDGNRIDTISYGKERPLDPDITKRRGRRTEGLTSLRSSSGRLCYS